MNARESQSLLPGLQKLDEELAKVLIAPLSESAVGVEEVSLSGVDFIFSSSFRHSFYILGKSREKFAIDELSIENLQRYYKETDINLVKDIDSIMSYVESDFSKLRREPLKMFLAYVDDDRNCLIDGEWYKFNQSYLSHLASEVDRVSLDYDKSFDLAAKINEKDFNAPKYQMDIGISIGA